MLKKAGCRRTEDLPAGQFRSWSRWGSSRSWRSLVELFFVKVRFQVRENKHWEGGEFVKA